MEFLGHGPILALRAERGRSPRPAAKRHATPFDRPGRALRRVQGGLRRVRAGLLPPRGGTTILACETPPAGHPGHPRRPRDRAVPRHHSPLHFSTTFAADDPEGLVCRRPPRPAPALGRPRGLRRPRGQSGARAAPLTGRGRVRRPGAGDLTRAASSLLRGPVLGALEVRPGRSPTRPGRPRRRPRRAPLPRRVALGRAGYHEDAGGAGGRETGTISRAGAALPGRRRLLETPRPHRRGPRRGGARRPRASGGRDPGGVQHLRHADPSRTLELGADLVTDSATRFLSGHSDALAGVLVTREPKVAEAPPAGAHGPGAVRARSRPGWRSGAFRTLLAPHPAPERRPRPGSPPGWPAGCHGAAPRRCLATPEAESRGARMSGPGGILAFELVSEEAAAGAASPAVTHPRGRPAPAGRSPCPTGAGRHRSPTAGLLDLRSAW